MKRLAYLPLPANQPRSNGRRPHDPSPPPPAPHPSSPATAPCLSLEPVEHPPPPSPAAQHAALPPRHAPSKCPAGHVPALAKSFTCTPCPCPPCDADSTSRAGPVSLRSFPRWPCLTSPPSLRLPRPASRTTREDGRPCGLALLPLLRRATQACSRRPADRSGQKALAT